MSSEAIDPVPWSGANDQVRELYAAEQLTGVPDVVADVIQSYMNVASRVPLLEAEQEVELAKQIEAGLFANAVLTVRQSSDHEVAVQALYDAEYRRVSWLHKKLEPEERHAAADTAATTLTDSIVALANRDTVTDQELSQLVQEGDDAFKQFSAANLRLAYSVARRYMGRGIALSDLVQEANMSLMHAVEKFDYTCGFKFSTYATFWLKRQMRIVLADQSQSYRVPIYTFEKLEAVKGVRRYLVRELNREPTVAEIAEKSEKTPEEVQALLRHDLPASSLDAPVGSSDDSQRVIDIVADTAEASLADDPLDQTIQEALRRDVRQLLTCLNERQMTVISMRYGLDGSEPKSCREVAEVLNMNRESIRQIEKRVLQRMRGLEASRHLLSYLRE